MLPEINALLVSNILGLFVCLVLFAFSLAGVGGVKMARAALISAWAVAVFGVCSSLNNAPWNHLLTTAGVVGVPVGLILIVVDHYVARHIRKRDTAILQAAKFLDAKVLRARASFETLTSEEMSLLHSIVLLGRSPGGPNVGQLRLCESVEQKTGFITRTHVGHYELNQEIKDALLVLLDGHELPKSPNLIAAADTPQLEIAFADRPPFVTEDTGRSGNLYKKRRVSVTSSLGGKVSLKVPQLNIGRASYPNVRLRSIEGQPEELEANEPGYWEVVQMNLAEASLKLLHIGKDEYKLGMASRFELVAKCAGVSKRTWCMARIDGQELLFQLSDNLDELPLPEVYMPLAKVPEAQKLTGRIVTLNIETCAHSDDEMDDLDCYLTFFLSVTNESDMPTIVNGFKLKLLWAGKDYDAVRESGPLDSYFSQRIERRHGDGKSSHEEEWKALTDFPANSEITNTNSVEGWLRFCVGRFPVEAMLSDQFFHKDVRMKLHALDRKRDRHTLYDGPVDFSLFGHCVVAARKKVVANVSSITSALENGSTYSVFLQVDPEIHASEVTPLQIQSRVSLLAWPSEDEYPKINHYMMTANIRFRFDNKGDKPGRVNDLNAALVIGGLVQPLSIIARSESGPKVNLVGLQLEPRKWTNYYWLECQQVLHPDMRSGLGDDAYLRLTLEALNQPAYCVELSVDWSRAEGLEQLRTIRMKQEGTCSPLLPTSLESNAPQTALQVVKRLVAFRDEGKQLQRSLSIERVLVPYADSFQEWRTKVQSYLDETSGGFARRFKSKAPEYPYPGKSSAETRELSDNIYACVLRLEEFIRERGDGT